jgi:hypothetical protein
MPDAGCRMPDAGNGNFKFLMKLSFLSGTKFISNLLSTTLKIKIGNK